MVKSLSTEDTVFPRVLKWCTKYALIILMIPFCEISMLFIPNQKSFSTRSKELAVNQMLFPGLMSEEPFKLNQTPLSIHGADKDSRFSACGTFIYCGDPMSSAIKYPTKSTEKTFGQQIIHFDDSCNGRHQHCRVLWLWIFNHNPPPLPSPLIITLARTTFT